MAQYRFIQKLNDGTIKQVNPFTGTKVWTVPERASRPLPNLYSKEPKLIELRVPEDYCSFCEGLERDTTPERSRLVLEDDKYRTLYSLLPAEAAKHPAVFRTISNLFAIVSLDYWRKNYGFVVPRDRKKWKDAYLGDSRGARHVKDILEYKFRCQGKTEEWIGQNVSMNWRDLADAFFASSHDLVISRRHYIKGACFENELASAGELSPEEHFQYIKYTLASILDIYKCNPHVVYTSVFQNWLSPAGASFDHLHKQILGFDEWGIPLEKMVRLVSKKPNAFNEMFLDYCTDEGLVLAENKNAVCVASFGERFPTLAVISKAPGRYPWELSAAEIRDMSNMLHAAHASLGADVAVNEEWFYTPNNSPVSVPWQVFVKWRLNNPAGFEGNTEIYINTVDPYTLRDRIVNELLRLRAKGKITSCCIGNECKPEKNALKYARKK